MGVLMKKRWWSVSGVRRGRFWAQVGCLVVVEVVLVGRAKDF